MFYFDKYGTPIENQFSKKDMPAGVTIKSVLTTLLPSVDKKVKAVKQSLW
jgi:hypothetical protein